MPRACACTTVAALTSTSGDLRPEADPGGRGASLSGSAPEAPETASLQALRAEEGFRFVVVHPKGWERPGRRTDALAALRARLGPPVLETPDGRLAWELPEP